MREKKISVLLNNYNYEAYIEQAIESVLHQTYKNWELIIVDDGSTDGSRKIIHSYANRYSDKILAVFKPNGGQASAFNTGFALAGGDIIAFLDSDDYWFAQKLAVIEKLHRQYEFVGHKQSSPKQPFVRPCMQLQDKRREIFLAYGLARLYHVFTSQMSFSRELLKQILPMPEKEFRICADEYVLFSGLYYKNMKFLNQELSYYRLHDKNAVFGRPSISRDAIEKRNFETIFHMNERLAERRLPSIPYWNLNLERKYLEQYEAFWIEQGHHYVIYGTGTASVKVREFIVFCGGIIRYYADSNEEAWGKQKEEALILSPEELVGKRTEYDKIIIGSAWIDAIRGRLEELGFVKGKDFIYSEMAFW